ncbi:metal-dependent hydrolase [Ectobacillus antri]|jgi:inner membrane protein|uniref:Metal-dependent hydrolase n=1 Tax=Ectobacillus antri TaxID=2486280 RepID=A0ABT6H7G5_9BACI|nr:metal-dependent hydrolase [Ectobacillus antri]MDG4658140.1 metal-dependent hydrolase [Ectobacillus antri]MDG5755266.1 metal-dependent hydrolase [Ectobacillus antri]
MDTITHTLFGLGLYGTIRKDHMTKHEKRAYLFTAIGASQIPDIDVISQLWDTQGLYQMWHRGITHSIFLMPLWALLFYALSILLFRVKSQRLFWLALLAVFIHSTSDLFNAWGTGYFEPFSQMRVTFGTIPIVDVVFWGILLVAYLIARKRKNAAPVIYRWAFAGIALHVLVQSAQGYILYEKYTERYEQVALSASFIPWHYTVIGKNGANVDLIDDSLLSASHVQATLISKEDADLNRLFRTVPEAKTLYEWAPFVVIVDDERQLGIYDPRFYRNGQSFLFEYMEKNGKVKNE